jgi:hypothetical protein
MLACLAFVIVAIGLPQTPTTELVCSVRSAGDDTDAFGVPLRARSRRRSCSPGGRHLVRQPLRQLDIEGVLEAQHQARYTGCEQAEARESGRALSKPVVRTCGGKQRGSKDRRASSALAPAVAIAVDEQRGASHRRGEGRGVEATDGSRPPLCERNRGDPPGHRLCTRAHCHVTEPPRGWTVNSTSPALIIA